jgi:hypothetical protein
MEGTMARATHYVVLPFEVSGRGGVKAGSPWPAQNAEHAKRLALRLAAKGGAVAFARTGDPAIGEYEDAEILGVYGEVPYEVLEAA